MPALFVVIPTCLLAAVTGTAASAASVEVTDGPIVLHSNLNVQWGDHAFSYALLGEKYLFWTAYEHPPDNPEALGKPIEPNALNEAAHWPVRLVGQYPLPGTDGEPRIYRFDGPEFLEHWGVHPLLCRTPDGYLHLLIGIYRSPNWDGYLRYYRSARPEDVSEWMDRTELIPTRPYDEFHLRMNFALSPDGQRAVIAVLAGGHSNQTPFNTPVVFYGRREGLDFHWEPPRASSERIDLFYPLVAPMPDGVVIVGRSLSADDPNVPDTSLLHLDWDGHLLKRERLPGFQGPLSLLSADLRPLAPGDTQRLLVYQNIGDWQRGARHDFFIYDTKERALRPTRQIRSSPEEFPGLVNAGKTVYAASGPLLLSAGPGGQYWAWEGDLCGGGDLHPRPLPMTGTIRMGFQTLGYPMVPNPLQGSLVRDGEAWVMSSAANPGKPPGRSQPGDGPYTLLLWRLRVR